MEYQVGEIFKFDGKYYQVVENVECACKNCSFNYEPCWQFDLGSCAGKYRDDNKDVCFKLVEDIGEIYKMFEELEMIVVKIEEANKKRGYDIWQEYYNQVNKIKNFISNNYGRKN